MDADQSGDGVPTHVQITSPVDGTEMVIAGGGTTMEAGTGPGGLLDFDGTNNEPSGEWSGRGASDDVGWSPDVLSIFTPTLTMVTL